MWREREAKRGGGRAHTGSLKEHGETACLVVQQCCHFRTQGPTPVVAVGGGKGDVIKSWAGAARDARDASTICNRSGFVRPLVTWNSLSRVGEACHTRINSARKLCPCFVSTSVAGAIHLLCRPGAEPSILLPQGMGHWQMKAMHCSWCLSPTVLWQCFCSHSIVQAGNGRGHRHEQGSTFLIGNV